jgi:hypothetical protein
MPLKEKGDRGECPHCGTGVQFLPGLTQILLPDVGGARRGFTDSGFDRLTYKYGEDSHLELRAVECPICSKLIISIDVPGPKLGDKIPTRVRPTIWPQTPAVNIPEDVPSEIARDYREAVAVRDRSQRAAAALLRRCLQATLIDAGDVKENAYLVDQIEEALPNLPGYLADDVDAIRAVGNFAAHPQKSEDPERLVEVEEDEVEWSLEVLFRLFDFYYVSRPRSEKRREKLNQKLEAAKKPPLKRRRPPQEG